MLQKNHIPQLVLALALLSALASNQLFYGQTPRLIAASTVASSLLSLLLASLSLALASASQSAKTPQSSLPKPLGLGLSLLLGLGLVFLHEGSYSLFTAGSSAEAYSYQGAFSSSTAFWGQALNVISVLNLVLIAAATAQMVQARSRNLLLLLGLPLLLGLVLALPLGGWALVSAGLTALATVALSQFMGGQTQGMLLASPLLLAGLWSLHSLSPVFFYQVSDYLHYPILALLAFTTLVNLLALANLVRVPRLASSKASLYR